MQIMPIPSFVFQTATGTQQLRQMSGFSKGQWEGYMLWFGGFLFLATGALRYRICCSMGKEHIYTQQQEKGTLEAHARLSAPSLHSEICGSWTHLAKFRSVAMLEAVALIHESVRTVLDTLRVVL